MKVIIKQPPWAVHKVWEVAGTRPGIPITTAMECLSGKAGVLLFFSMQESQSAPVDDSPPQQRRHTPGWQCPPTLEELLSLSLAHHQRGHTGQNVLPVHLVGLQDLLQLADGLLHTECHQQLEEWWQFLLARTYSHKKERNADKIDKQMAFLWFFKAILQLLISFPGPNISLDWNQHQLQ